LAFAASFQTIYSHQTLYPSLTVAFPIVGAVVKAAPREPFVVFERQEEPANAERWAGREDFDEVKMAS
jgi:hypothetical protein